MADKLVVVERYSRYHIQWELDDGDDMGATLCESSGDGIGPAPTNRDDWLHWIACKTVRELPGFSKSANGAMFDTEKEARNALRIVKEAMKQDRQMPDWAKQALENGWKPPKGWKA